MATLLERSNQAIPVTEVSRSSKKILDDLLAGEQDKYVVIRNNAPAAVMMSVDHYENLMDLIDDLQLEIEAAKRLGGYDKSKALSHEKMTRRFEGSA